MNKLLVLLLSFFLLSSCSRLDIAAQLAGAYVTNKADDYFDLTNSQSRWLKDNFNLDFAKIKKTIFPKISAELLKASDMISSGKNIDAKIVMNQYEQIKNLFYDALKMFTPRAVLFADMLTPSQVTYFQKEAKEKMEDLREEDSHKDTQKKLKKNFDSWIGSLSSSQKKEIDNFVVSSPSSLNEKLRHRQDVVQGFISAYPEKMQRKTYVERVFNSYESFYAPAYAKTVREENNKMAGFVASMLNKMSDEQRKTLIDNLRDRANQLMKLSRG